MQTYVKFVVNDFLSFIFEIYRSFSSHIKFEQLPFVDIRIYNEQMFVGYSRTYVWI